MRKPGELPTGKSLHLLLDVASAVRAIQILEGCFFVVMKLTPLYHKLLRSALSPGL